MNQNQKNNFLAKYTLIDALFVCYMFFLSVLLLLFHNGVQGWFYYILAHLAVIAVILFSLPALEKTDKPFPVFIRWWYPVLLFTFNYREINAFTHILVNEWKDAEIAAFEKMILGINPTIWLERFAAPWLTEFMKFDYFTYYLMIPVGAGFLYFAAKRKNYIRYLSTVCLAFYISYIGFIVYPVRGPRYLFHDKYSKDYTVNIGSFYGSGVKEDVKHETTYALKGYFFTDLQDYIMKYGSLHGGCMPSSHIAVAFVCMMMMWIYKRKVFYFYLPAVTVLCIAVVYNRYHYVSDVAAGILVGVLSLWLTPMLLKGWEKISN